MRKSLSFVLLLVFSVPASAAASLDLGQKLAYVRVHSLDEAIKPLAGTEALVLDLRRVVPTPEAMTAFSTALSARSAAARLFVLVSPDTPAAVGAALKGNLLTLGIKGSHPEPQVVVAQSSEDDQRAYDALASGTTLAELISGKIEKERFDEASLVHEFKNGVAGPLSSTTTSPTGNESPARLTDRVLQRAVHLHRALLALKR